MIPNKRFPITNPPMDGLTFSLPLVSASRLNPSMSLASLRLHSPCPPLDGLAVARRITINKYPRRRRSLSGFQDFQDFRFSLSGFRNPHFFFVLCLLSSDL